MTISRYRMAVAGVTALSTALAITTLAFTGSASAAPSPTPTTTGKIIKIIHPPAVYKPHETVQGNGFWISSNERDKYGGITVFNSKTNKVISKAFVDGRSIGIFRPNGKRIFTKGAAEQHYFHPHGIALSANGNWAYQVLEGTGLKWNKGRTDIVRAKSGDNESGALIVWDLRNKAQPKYAGGYLTGHAPHEAAVDPVSGLVYVGNHEDSPTTAVHNWVSVFNTKTHKYGFIDTGAWQALQGIWYDQADHQIKAISHVGERMYAFKAGVWPKHNTAADTTAQMRRGANTIAYFVPLRASFVERFPKISKVMGLPLKRAKVNFKSPEGMPMVLHFHDITVNEKTGVAYAVVHSVHHAEHTGSAAEYRLLRKFPPPPESTESATSGEEEEAEHFMGRWMAVITPNRKVSWVNLSNGYGPGKYPDAETVMRKSGVKGRAAVNVLEHSFVHGHFLDVAPDGTVVVSGEHTGNIGLVRGHKLVDVIPISQLNKNAKPDKTTGFFDEPHLHGLNIDQSTGLIYAADEGEHGYRESVTILKLK